MKIKLLLVIAFLVLLSRYASAQQSPVTNSVKGTTGDPTKRPSLGPHSGALKQVSGLQLETVVSQGGIKLYAYEKSGMAVAVGQARGSASLLVEGNAKRYRYDLLPDGKGGLAAVVNLSKVAGRQIEIEIKLVGIGASRGQTIALKEVATVPSSKLQLAANAIERQKLCPVSGKLLGSMGEPVEVTAGKSQVFVCCAGCVKSVQANPAKYVSGRPPISTSKSTAADAAAIARQKTCPVMDEPLGGMGTPIKVMVGKQPIFLCCKGCVKRIEAEPAKYLKMVYGAAKVPSVSGGTEAVRAGVFKVTAADTPFIAAQKKCPVMDEPLDAMGGPYKVHAAGKAIYICCPGCAKMVAAEPQKWIDALAKQGVVAPTLR